MSEQLNRVFDWVPDKDPANKLYRATRRAYDDPVSVLHECGAWLDQGEEGACVGFGLAHLLACNPPAMKVDARFAREGIYYPSQRRDEYPGGEYPNARPRMQGTSLKAACKVLVDIGACDGFEWVFGFDEWLHVIPSKPVVLGTKWYGDMMRPDGKGYVYASGVEAGGHCWLTRGNDQEKRRGVGRNSWGPHWGRKGDFFISHADLRKLLDEEDGEAVTLVNPRAVPLNAVPVEHRNWFARLFGF